MVEIICKFTNLKFEATTKRTQVHPKIANWKQSANKQGWYRRFFEAIDYGVSKDFSTIEQFDEILSKASQNEPLEFQPEPEPTRKSFVVAELDKAWNLELERHKGSFCKKIESVDSRINTGYSLIGEVVDLDSDFEDGIYLDCATDAASNNDKRKQRKPYSQYTLFKIEQQEIKILLQFRGRRLNETREKLAEVWELAKANGISDLAETETIAKLQTQKIVESRNFLGRTGEVIKFEESYYFILHLTSVRWSEDEDGIIAPGSRTVGDLGAVIVAEWYEYTYYLRPATEQEITQ